MSDKADNTARPAYLDTSLSFEERARDLVSRMTRQEKVSQMTHEAAAIERLGVPAYNWWNECLHGVGRAGIATVFPQTIGMAATWDTDLISEVAEVISDEARAKHHEALRRDDHSIYRGLTFWTPNINIFRDPRWGRGQETYGEDPYLTGRIGVEFVKGIQGDDPKYLKLVATPKHYAVHSGPEKDRHTFDAVPSAKDFRETYLPAFEMCVKEANAQSVMTAYNRVYGEPCSGSELLMEQILRDEWGFDGYVVSDCGAVEDFHLNHKVTRCTAESAAKAVKAGCDLNCGYAYTSLLIALDKGLITEAEIDKAVMRLLTARFRLGMFDPEEMVPYASIPYEVNDCEGHRQIARRTAQESIVLLKNTDGLLPLSKDLKTIAVIGPNADALDVLLGNYNGTPSMYSTPLDGIRAKLGPDTRLFYAKGCDIAGDSKFGFSEAISAAVRADVVVMCLGISPALEGEEGDAFNSDASGDRIRIDLPAIQQELLEAVCATGKPVVLVLMSGSALAVNWAQENVPAIVQAWYPGEEGGNAIADVLFGDFNPCGRLPVTYVKSLDDLPPFEDYNMRGRTYRYMECEPLYPFGFGLSYTSFEYSDLSVGPRSDDGELSVSVSVRNAGTLDGAEVVQLYLSRLDSPVPTPIRQLAGFTRVVLAPGETKTVEFTITGRQTSYVDNDGKLVSAEGSLRLTIGGNQGDARSLALGGADVLSTILRLV